MSSYSTYTYEDPYYNRDDRFERQKHTDEVTQEESRNEIQSVKKQHSKHDTWKGVFVVTQFWVICFASVGFLAVVTATVAKLTDRQILETKDRVTQEHTWFKFAICLRPFMTDSMMKEMYDKHFHKNFTKHIQSLNVSDEGKAEFYQKFYLDNMLEPKAYQNYFRYVHPWDEFSPYALWEFQNNTIRRAFEEFLVNTVSMGITKEENITDDTKEGGQYRLEKYSILPPPQQGNATDDQPPLVGEYLLSPIYMGCLSMTLNKEMANKQMDISIKFRPRKLVMSSAQSKKKAMQALATRFEAADIFVFNKNESFTEISTIKQNAKFSVMADTRERLLVMSSMFIRQKSKKRNCELSETNSELTCRKDCIYKGLLDEISCTLPWMERLRDDPIVSAKYASLPKCTDLGPNMMLETSVIQETFMYNTQIMQKQNVQTCLNGCFESCRSSMVRILSLGSKSIGSNYGVTLTVSPAIDVVREHFNYNFTNMVSELCASVSFLLGLSAIAIYDWVVAFGVWVAVRLGLHSSAEEEKTDSTTAEDTAEKAEGQKDDPAAATAAPPAEQVESATGVKKRRVSVQIPAVTAEQGGETPV